MTQPNPEPEDANAPPAVKLIAVIELINAIQYLSEVVYAFVNSDIITREGSQRLDQETAEFFIKVKDILSIEQDIFRARGDQSDIL